MSQPDSLKNARQSKITKYKLTKRMIEAIVKFASHFAKTVVLTEFLFGYPTSSSRRHYRTPILQSYP